VAVLLTALAGCANVIDLSPIVYRDDTAERDAGPEGGTTATPCPSSARTCEDFERGAVGNGWITDSSDDLATVAVDKLDKHGGSFALHTIVPTHASLVSGSIRFTFDAPVSGGSVVVRAWFKLSKALANASLIELRHKDRGRSCSARNRSRA
jgi:hypothetical protein